MYLGGENMKIETSKDLRLELVKAEKTATWLAQQLGYSPAYMYKCIQEQKQKEINRMIKILEAVD